MEFKGDVAWTSACGGVSEYLLPCSVCYSRRLQMLALNSRSPLSDEPAKQLGTSRSSLGVSLEVEPFLLWQQTVARLY